MTAERIPIGIVRHIVEERLIDSANQMDNSLNGVMYYLFELHTQYIDPTGQFDNWNCPICKDHVMTNWKRLKPYLESIAQELKTQHNVHNNA